MVKFQYLYSPFPKGTRSSKQEFAVSAANPKPLLIVETVHILSMMLAKHGMICMRVVQQTLVVGTIGKIVWVPRSL